MTCFPKSVLLVVLVLTACCSDSNNGSTPTSPEPDTNTDSSEVTESTAPTNTGNSADLRSIPRWTLGPSNHEGDIDQASAFGSNDTLGTITISTTGFQPENGAYAGSAITIQHSLGGAGEYTLVDSTESLLAGLGQNPASKLAFFTSSAGTQVVNPLRSTSWQSTVGTLTVALDEAGRYHFFSNGTVVLTRQINIGGGVPDSPDQIDFEMVNVYGATDIDLPSGFNQ